MVLVDTNILLDIANLDPVWLHWSLQHLRQARSQETLCLNIIIYTELIPAYQSSLDLDTALAGSGILRIELPYACGPIAARAFSQYRKRGGSRTAPLPDFFIGAHAEAAGMMLLTRDPQRYRTYFPAVKLICP